MANEAQAVILIVEDDPGVARLQQLRVERAGYRVVLASTASQALQCLDREPVDLLLLDQNLPGDTSGLDLYRQVKAAGRNVPAILVTSFAGEEIVLRALRSGVFDFVPKTPDYLEYLLPTIDRVLQARQIEFQLAESEAQLSGIIASAMDGVLTVDEEHRIGLFNPAAEQMFGCSKAEALGQSVEKLLPHWSALRPFSEPGRPRAATTGETEAIRTDGVCFPVEIAISWLETPRRRFWTCLVRDIRERRQAQEERERLIREQAARREAEAARAQMEAAARENARLYHELRKSNELKDEFLALLSHELRNPLAPIRNALNFIHLAPPHQDADVRENYAIMQRQVDQLVRLVDDLLDVNRIQQGKIQLRKERVAVRQLVERAVESSKPLIDERRQRLTVRLPDPPLILDADPVRIVQVLANLLNNAAKYTPKEGSIQLTASEDGRKGSPWVMLRVSDTGMGIAAEMLPRLFDAFTQSVRTLDRADGGLGIGLTLVRRLTELHGGSVEVHSAGLGMGSAFTVRLPLVEQMSTPAAPHVNEDHTALKRRILVVDDNRDSAITLAQLLTLLGHETRTAYGGPDALEFASAFEPEVVLLDIGLPGMDGYEVARRIRKDRSRDGTRLVALTGYGSSEDRRRSQEAGFDAHLVKPVDLETLQQILNQR